MLLTMRCPGRPAEDELRSLQAWLETDRTVRRHVRATLATDRVRVPGQQGDVIDLLSLVLGSGFSAASLAATVVSWRATRPQLPTLVVERPDGTRVEFHGRAPEEAEALLRRLLEDGADHHSHPDQRRQSDSGS